MSLSDRINQVQAKANPPRQSGHGSGKPEIACGSDHVVICEQCVRRPSYLSPKQWLDFWERIIARELI
jgi:hypothetical protein